MDSGSLGVQCSGRSPYWGRGICRGALPSKAKQVCRLVLPDGTHWFSFSGGSCAHYLSTTGGGKYFLVDESGTVVPVLTGAASWCPSQVPLGVSATPALACFTSSPSHDHEVWRALSATNHVGIVTQGQGTPDHQMLHSSGTQHVEAFWILFALLRPPSNPLLKHRAAHDLQYICGPRLSPPPTSSKVQQLRTAVDLATYPTYLCSATRAGPCFRWMASTRNLRTHSSHSAPYSFALTHL